MRQNDLLQTVQICAVDEEVARRLPLAGSEVRGSKPFFALFAVVIISVSVRPEKGLKRAVVPPDFSAGIVAISHASLWVISPYDASGYEKGRVR